MAAIESWAQTNPGTVRKYNEDNLLARPELGLWAVADGAGGHHSGDLASSMIVEALAKLPEGLGFDDLTDAVRRSINATHRALRATATSRGPAVTIASTFVGLIIRGEQFCCLWAGDSRAYLLRNGDLLQLSRDHSLVQELVDLGQVSLEDAEHHHQANIITRAVGGDRDEIMLDAITGTAKPNDLFLLCSDGLNKTLPFAEISQLLQDADRSRVAPKLVAAALDRGGRDNVTVLVISIPESCDAVSMNSK